MAKSNPPFGKKDCGQVTAKHNAVVYMKKRQKYGGKRNMLNLYDRNARCKKALIQMNTKALADILLMKIRKNLGWNY